MQSKNKQLSDKHRFSGREFEQKRLLEAANAGEASIVIV